MVDDQTGKPEDTVEPSTQEGGDLWQVLQGSDSPPQTTDDPASPTSPEPSPEQHEPPDETYRGETEPVPDGFVAEDAVPSLEDHSEDALSLQKVLADPEKFADEVDYSTTPASEDHDFDAEVFNFYKEDLLQIKCKNHAERDHAGQCPECQAYYCQECLVVRVGRLLCRDCAETIYVPTEEEVLSAAEQGLEAQGAGVTPEEKPEFQVGNSALGLDGRPAHPVKRLGAMAFDLVLTRLFVFVVLFIANWVAPAENSELLQVVAVKQGGGFPYEELLQAFFLLTPPVPWIILFAIVDFAYYFLTLAFFNRTAGMSWLGCRVVSEWGEFVSFGGVALRTLLFMIMLGFPAILIGWFFPAYRGPHDYAAGTLVINYAGVKRVDAYETVQIKL